MSVPSIVLNNGTVVPAVGFGTSMLNGKNKDREQKDIILEALEAGYRYIDSASLYESERAVGEALRESGLKREEVMVASKMWWDETGYQETKDAFRRTLDRLAFDYLDVYLIHWPKRSNFDEDWKKRDVETWRAMEEFHEQGLIRNLGVSNFLPHHLKNLLDHAAIKPVFDQLENHLGYFQEYAVRYCQEIGVQPQAWSPAGGARGVGELFESELYRRLAGKYGVTVPQLSLRFLVQRGVMPLPFSSRKERIRENLAIFDFELSEEDMSVLSSVPMTGWRGDHPDVSMPLRFRSNFSQ